MIYNGTIIIICRQDMGTDTVSPDAGPVTKVFTAVDRLLSILILIMGIGMMGLAVQYGNISLGLTSLVFLGIGFFKTRSLFAGVFRRLKRRSEK
jgi:hypothetical protein